MSRNIFVTESQRCSIEDDTIEMCEHKGIGQPDTLTDGACEASPRTLSLA